MPTATTNHHETTSLDTLSSTSSDFGGKKYTRDINKRIFVNRTVNMDRIEYIGFDMDYTLAVYKSPAFEELAYNLCIEKLIAKGYPEEIRKFRYDPNFSQRGVFLDKKNGNLLKVDAFGYILRAIHGKQNLRDPAHYHSRFQKEYPNKLIHTDDIGTRFHSFDTLFDLPEMCLYSDLVELFESKRQKRQERLQEQQQKGGESPCDNGNGENGQNPLDSMNCGDDDEDVSYQSLFEDVRESVHLSHIDGQIKSAVLSNLDKYVHRDDRLAHMLHMMREQGRKLFLLTNSEYYYTKEIMAYLLEGVRDDYANWMEYFDIIITSARKPYFFGTGTTLREVHLPTGNLKFSALRGFERGTVYSGGSIGIFNKFTGTNGSEVLYVGDNLFHDVIYGKKKRCLWRTLLVIRELDHEIDAWKKNMHHYKRLQELEYLRAQTYARMDTRTKIAPKAQELKLAIRKTTEELDSGFNKFFGALFRSGSSESFFMSQCKRFADLYCSDHLHLLEYPLFYFFSAMPVFASHEKAVMQESPHVMCSDDDEEEEE